ncbi:MAG TPA: DNA mismatch repair protein MutS [Planctomycetota bacterium]|nr:DNA mismatch repair protein MutS [Planctomycetota bacterium]
MSGQASLFGASPEPAPPAEPTPAAAPGRASRAGAARPRPTAAVRAAGNATPMMEQYGQAKREAGDALLFFRMGDFYELFGEDAKIASRALGITLTARSQGEGAVPMAGVPVKAYQGYLQQLIRAGFRVAICDQMEDPALAKGLVDRQVTRIVTAGTVFEDDLLERGASNYLLGLAPQGDRCGLAWLDVSTGAFSVAEVPVARVADEVARLEPAEIVVPESLLEDGERRWLKAQGLTRAGGAALVRGAEWTFQAGNALATLREQLRVQTLAGYGLADDALAVRAAGGVLAYVRETQRGALPAVSGLRLHDPSAAAGLDRATRSCLELLATQREGRREGSLLAVLDRTATAMGARLLREWIVAPLVDPAAIRRRQGAVAELLARRDVHERLARELADLPDLERIATRLLAGRASPRDLGALRAGLAAAPALKELLAACDSAPLAEAASEVRPLPELLDVLRRGLAEHPPLLLNEGGLIAPGWNARLDELRSLRENGAAAIARFQSDEIGRTGIASLKVVFNRVFGYTIEVSNAHAARVPADYVRRQTLSSAERYVNPELKALETAILSADEQARGLESELFLELRERAARDGESIRELARALARVDVLCGFATLARDRAWVRPEVDDGELIDIEAGRHPVLEALLPAGAFVPNDIRLDREDARLVLVTGPNMAGKSTYIRQVALLVLLAQVGSFVPAARARVGIVDRIFTRIGSADDLSAGASTFMVEMTETAAILNGATARSLVILDEVGRGTSTWDGLSLAWAISEYLYRAVGARTLFATHYHELIDLAEEFPAVRNVNVAVQERGDDVVFLHRIVAGGTDRSYGLHVARLAGVPAAVIERARRILADLETRSPDLKPRGEAAPAGAPAAEPAQQALFPRAGAAILDEIAALDPDAIAPLDALLLLKQLRDRLAGESA